jgi:hypothetical protein
MFTFALKFAMLVILNKSAESKILETPYNTEYFWQSPSNAQL